MQNGFDDFDTTITAEEYYLGEGYDADTIDEFIRQDEQASILREVSAWEDEMKFLDALDNYPALD